MATLYTTLLGLALPTQGELSGSWGNVVNDNITNYLDAAVAGALTVTTDTTLTKTTNANLGATSSQYAIIIASPASANITITAPAASKIYTIINTSATYTVKIVGAGPTTGVTLGVSEKAQVAWNGSDFVKIGAPLSTPYTANGVVYASSSSALTTGSALTFNGTNLVTTGSATGTAFIPSGSTVPSNGMYLPTTNTVAWSTNTTERMRLDASGNLGLGVTPSAWGSTYKAFETTNGSVAGVSGALVVANNLYYNGSNWIYKATAGATLYSQSGSTNFWYNAPSGTAGNTVILTQAMTLDASGNLLVGTTSAVSGGGVLQVSNGITFPATQVPSANANTLDDYEEGTWVPTQGAGLTVVGAFTSEGRYTKVGRLVYVWGKIAGATSIATTAGTIMCQSFPFSAAEVSPIGVMNTDNRNVLGGSSVFNTTAYSETTFAATPVIYFNITYTV